jgi:hypothetical protein
MYFYTLFTPPIILSIQLNTIVTGRWSYKYKLNGERKVTGIKHSYYTWKRNRLVLSKT